MINHHHPRRHRHHHRHQIRENKDLSAHTVRPVIILQLFASHPDTVEPGTVSAVPIQWNHHVQ